MTKRRFLTVLAGGMAAVFSLRFLKRFDFAESLLPQMPVAPTRGRLLPAEMAVLLAYTEALADDRDLAESARDFLREHINDRTENEDGYLELYQMAAAFVDRLDARGFSGLSRRQRVALLEAHGLMSCRVHRRECFSPFGRTERMVRGLAAPDLVGAYYRSAAGWAVLGYSVYPGGCGDLHRYTGAEILPA